MAHEFEILEKRVKRLESQNVRLRCLGMILMGLALGAAVWGQTIRNAVLQAQRIELRDDAGRLRAELAILNGEPTLRFFDVDGDTQSLLSGDSFNIFKKGGDNQAVFRKNGLQFGDGRGKDFVMIDAYDEDQMGKIELNDYRNREVHTVLTPQDLRKLLDLAGQKK